MECLLLVEGNDEKKIIEKICQKAGIEFPPYKDLGGNSKLTTRVRAELKANINTRIGIVVDAETNFQNTWNSIRNALSHESLNLTPIPRGFPQNGLIHKSPENEQYPLVGVWIMPNNESPGMLEDFLQELIPAERRPLLDHVKSSIDSIPEDQYLIGQTKKPKARLYTYLSWQKDPDPRAGLALSKSLLNAENESAEKFLHWFKHVFQQPI